MEFFNDIDKIRSNNHKLKFINELNYLKKRLETSENKEWINKRIDVLTKIVKELGGIEDITSGIIDPMDKMYKEIDKYIYQKPWNRLIPIHKLQKISEYLDENFKDQKIRQRLYSKLEKEINNGRLNTKKYVNYDQSEEKIINISAIVENEDGHFDIKI